MTSHIKAPDPQDLTTWSQYVAESGKGYRMLASDLGRRGPSH
ncbi:hypothetical protein [Streptomyces sp. NRRL F-5755]|nr:hypothetical protein [Streptomyces sp. NRRL F-5755]